MKESATERSCNRNLPHGEVKEKEEVKLQGKIQIQSWKIRWH